MRRALQSLGLGVLMAFTASVPVLYGSQLSDEIYNQGIAHYAKNNFRDAEFYLGQVLHDNPQHNLARYYLAAAMASMGKVTQAIPHLEYLVNAEPQNKTWQSYLQQLKDSLKTQPAQTQPTATIAQPSNASGDAYIPGIQKIMVIGGGNVPLISDGAPPTPAPNLPAKYENLQESFGSSDPQVRRTAIKQLTSAKDAALLPLFAWALDDQPCRELAARALINLGSKGVDKIISYAGSNVSASDKKFAYGMLGSVANANAEKFLLESWKKGDTAHQSALEAVLAEKGKKILPEIIAELNNSNRQIRYSAAKIIDNIGNEAIMPLIDVLSKEKGAARVEAVAILDGLSRDEVFKQFPKELLEKLTKDETVEVAAFASSLLPKAEPVTVPDIIP